MIHQPQSAGPVRYLLTGHLWTSPRLSARDKFILTVNQRGTLGDMCNRRKHQNNTIYQQKHTSAGLLTLLFMKRLLMVLGLATADFFTFFLASAPLAPAFPASKTFSQKISLFVQNYLRKVYLNFYTQNTKKKLCNVILYECLPLLFSTTSSSKSSSKISLPSSTYPIPSEEEKLSHHIFLSHTYSCSAYRTLRLTIINNPVILLSVSNYL